MDQCPVPHQEFVQRLGRKDEHQVGKSKTDRCPENGIRRDARSGDCHPVTFYQITCQHDAEGPDVLEAVIRFRVETGGLDDEPPDDGHHSAEQDEPPPTSETDDARR